MDDRAFTKLVDYLERVPAIRGSIGRGSDEQGGWWVKITIDVDHELAWNAVQELSYVLNEFSITERLPTVFKPTSPPPYLNGGPREYLSWLIECHTMDFRPETLAEWLENRLPQPVEDLEAWRDED